MFVTVIDPLTNKILYSKIKSRKSDLEKIANELAKRYQQIRPLWIEFRVVRDMPNWLSRRKYV